MVHPGFAYYPPQGVDPYQDDNVEDDPYQPAVHRHRYPIYEIPTLITPTYDDFPYDEEYDDPYYPDSLLSSPEFSQDSVFDPYYDNSLAYDPYDPTSLLSSPEFQPSPYEGNFPRVPPSIAAYPAYDDSLAYDPYAAWDTYVQDWGGGQLAPKRIDATVFVAVALTLLLLVTLLVNRGTAVQTVTTPFNLPVQVTAVPLAPAPVAPAAPAPLPADAFLAPYDSYVLTQGLHGYSYGHMAIDIKAGEGATIKSPIAGVVSALYVDGLGNTTLVIENDYYQATFLHGLYTVAVGDVLEAGQAVGTESNQGNTVDWAGNSCRGRNCGHHTHLNVFDKRLGQNVDPLALIDTFR
jgi:murein DD-endopeptidase MepM/ murein hydrolase activator NlpD